MRSCWVTNRVDGAAQFRRGYSVGDGTGGGKGRLTATIIADNMAQGRTWAVWVSKNNALLEDARRNWSGSEEPLRTDAAERLEAVGGHPPLAAILFTTYSTVRHPQLRLQTFSSLRGRPSAPSQLGPHAFGLHTSNLVLAGSRSVAGGGGGGGAAQGIRRATSRARLFPPSSLLFALLVSGGEIVVVCFGWLGGGVGHDAGGVAETKLYLLSVRARVTAGVRFPRSITKPRRGRSGSKSTSSRRSLARTLRPSSAALRAGRFPRDRTSPHSLDPPPRQAS